MVGQQRLQVVDQPVGACDREPSVGQFRPARDQKGQESAEAFVFEGDVLVVTQEYPILNHGMFLSAVHKLSPSELLSS